MRHLADAWLRTLRALGGHSDVADTGADLLARYAEPHRRYHTAVHLANVLASVDELADIATEVETVRLAAFFHDAVYDPLRADNEERSAQLALVMLTRLRLDEQVISEVARLVRLTTSHDPEPDDRDGAVLCDADLAVLAGEPESYARYVDAVRAEYAALDEATWRTGRAAVLRSLLARPSLYRTAPYAGRLEGAARANLMGELAGLAEERTGPHAGGADPPPAGGTAAPGS